MSAFESGADASLTSQQLKRLTNKMAETKRLIKEFEKTALREGAMDERVGGGEEGVRVQTE